MWEAQRDASECWLRGHEGEVSRRHSRGMGAGNTAFTPEETRGNRHSPSAGGKWDLMEFGQGTHNRLDGCSVHSLCWRLNKYTSVPFSLVRTTWLKIVLLKVWDHSSLVWSAWSSMKPTLLSLLKKKKKKNKDNIACSETIVSSPESKSRWFLSFSFLIHLEIWIQKSCLTSVRYSVFVFYTNGIISYIHEYNYFKKWNLF